MIGSISGTVRHKDLQSLLVDVGGVGYKVFSTTEAVLEAALGEPIFLWTHLSIRENAHDLFGFKDKEALETFELLISIPGIGPRTALGILNVATPSMLRQAVATEDTSYLTKVSGIGKKNAEKIVLELKGKLHTTTADKGVNVRMESDALEALVSLGYSERDARDALKRLSSNEETEDTSERVKQALRLLSEKH